MPTYDAEQTPDRDSWLAADESERILAVQRWHKHAKITLPNEKAHAVFHVIVENQIAGDLGSVCRAIPRLMSQGLSRHDALHAVAWVLASHIHELLSASADPVQQSQVQARYDAEVERLTAYAWKHQIGQ